MAWGMTEWLEMIMLGLDAGRLLPTVQIFLALLALVARTEFARTSSRALGRPDWGVWPSLAFAALGVSGVF